MKKLFTIFTVLLTAVLGAAPAAKIFEADYRTGKADAVIAKGDPAAKFTGQPEFTPQGVVIGKGKTSLRYNSAGNLNAASGAIEICFDSGNLNWHDAKKLILMQCIGKDLTFYIYKHSTDGLGAYFGNRDPKWTAFPRATAPRLGGKKLYHLVINYSGDAVECYVDGKLMRSLEVTSAPAEFGKYFFVGPAGKRFGGDTVCTIAKVAAYDRPLSAAEIRALHSGKSTADAAAPAAPAVKKNDAAAKSGTAKDNYALAVFSDLHYTEMRFHSPDPKRAWVMEQAARYARVWREITPKMLARAAAKNPEFALALGDNLEGYFNSPANQAQALRELDKQMKQFFRKPWIPVVGNHEYSPAANREAYFETAAELGLTPASRSFHRRYGKDLYIFWDNISARLAPVAKALQENPDARYVFLVCHYPVLPVSGRGIRAVAFGNKHQDGDRRKLLDMLASRNAIVLCGHIHRFALSEFQNSAGRITQVMFNSTVDSFSWLTPKEMAVDSRYPFISEIDPAKVKDPADAAQFLAEYQPHIKKTVFINAVGYGVLKVSASGVAVELFSGSDDARFAAWQLRPAVVTDASAPAPAAAPAVSAAKAVSPVKSVQDAILFDADYLKLHYSGHANAQFAKGSPQGIILHEPRPRYDVEAMESLNRGLMVGEGCASVRYQSEGNLNPVQGSIEVVFTNYLWDFNQRGVHVFLQCLGGGKNLYIYKHHTDGVGAYFGNTNPKWSFFPRQLPAKLKGRSPHHLLVTYAPDAIRLYMDGLLVREAMPQAKFDKWHKYFEVGPAGKFGRDSRTTIARVTTYNRPLTDDEVLALAAARIPDLKLSGVKAVKRVVTPKSTFIANPGKHGVEALADDYVVSPWTPVEKSGRSFKVWNRTYDFSGSDLVTQIATGDGELLRDGVNIIVTKEGKSEKIAFGDLTMLLDAKGRKRFIRHVTSPAYLTGSVTTTVTYDGMVDFEFDLAGIDRADKIDFRCAMARNFSNAIHYNGTNGWNMRSSVAPDKSYSKTLDDRPGVVFAREFMHHIWLGSDAGGVQVFHNDDKPFWPKDRQDCMQIVRNDKGESDIALRYATAKFPVKAGKLAFRCGIIATPVRPMPENWRAWNFSAQYDSFVGKRRGTHLIYWPDYWGEQVLLDANPERATKKERNAAKIKLDHAENRKVIPYWDHRHVGIRKENVVNGDEQYVRENWGTIPQRPPSGGIREYLRVASSSPYADFLARCVYEYSKIMGTIDGVYIDEMEPTPNARAATGGGYESIDGSRRLTFGLYSDRDMYRRLDAVVRAQNNGEMPMNIAHCSGTHMMEILSHFPIFLTAEHLYSGYFPDNKELIPPEHDRLYYYSYALPMDRVRTEFYHRPWGAVMVFLPCLKNQRDIMTRVEPTRDLLSRVMHADILFWPLWCNAQEIYKVEDFRRKWDIGNKAVRFIPYWENKEVTSATPDSCISYYDKNGEKLAIVSNLARKNQTVNVKLPAGTTAVINAETEQPLAIENGSVNIQMKRNDYCALIIKR
ncbi:MAG: metallophosphoesterase [Lentisphaeria bacterium]|nr:metallophosphoesterase [Lentisphaeria bacterium]